MRTDLLTTLTLRALPDVQGTLAMIHPRPQPIFAADTPTLLPADGREVAADVMLTAPILPPAPTQPVHVTPPTAVVPAPVLEQVPPRDTPATAQLLTLQAALAGPQSTVAAPPPIAVHRDLVTQHAAPLVAGNSPAPHSLAPQVTPEEEVVRGTPRDVPQAAPLTPVLVSRLQPAAWAQPGPQPAAGSPPAPMPPSPTPASDIAPVIQVTIGRIEVRGQVPAQPAARVRRDPAATSLESYQQQRSRRGGRP